MFRLRNYYIRRINLLIIVIKEKLINITLNKPIEKNAQRLREEIYSTGGLEITPELDQVSKTNNVNLAQPTITMVREFFNKETSHRPSEEMYEALLDIALTLEDMANGKAENKIHLSSLAPGIGKTQTICFFLNLLLKEKQYEDKGILIGLSSYDEIESYLSRIDVQPHKIGILTSDKTLNLKSNKNTNEAQILFTTQQMMDSRLKDKLFSEGEEFYYKGKPRQIRIWDESFMPGEPIVVNRDKLQVLLPALRRPYPRLTEKLDDLINTDLKSINGEQLYDLPDLKEEYDLDLNQLTGILQSEEVKKVEIDNASNFWFLLGKTVSVRKDGIMGITALSYKKTIPDDITPLLVLDASGSCRGTYVEMDKHKKNIIRLKEAPKDHSDLEIHHWVRGSGKKAFRDHMSDYVHGIANTINDEPDKEWLIIIHKNIYKLDESIKQLLVEEVDKKKINFITWGKHKATNYYAHIERVILAGILYYSPSQHEGLGRLASGKAPEDGKYSKESINRVALGELKHVILQGACRGAVRLCDGDKCKPCKIYVMGAKKSGVKQELFQELFPRSTYSLWRPIKRELKGRVKAAMDYLIERFSDHKVDYVSFKEVMEIIDFMTTGKNGKSKPDSANFKNSIRRHSEFEIALTEAGLEEWGKNPNYKTGFTRIDIIWDRQKEEPENL